MHEINSIEQLRTMSRRAWRVSLLGQMPRARFAIPELPESSNQEASQLLSNYRNECGCVAGGLVMGATVIGFFVDYWANGRGILEFRVSDLVVLVALFVGGTLAGKMFGVLWARVRMVQVVRGMMALANRQASNA